MDVLVNVCGDGSMDLMEVMDTWSSGSIGGPSAGCSIAVVNSSLLQSARQEIYENECRDHWST